MTFAAEHNLPAEWSRRRPRAWPALLASLALGAGATSARCEPLLRFADVLVSYVQGAGAQPGYTDPSVAIGPPSTGHTPTTPLNDDPETLRPTVVSLGQGGSITLRFNRPVRNQPPSPANPRGYDFLVWGNTLQGFMAITPELELGRFNEQGFIEVAQADENGSPIEWFLVLPRIFYDSVRMEPVPRDFLPAQLIGPTVIGAEFVASGDVGTSASLFDGFADAVPARGAQLAMILATNQLADVVLDDPATFEIEGLGGTGVDLTRAVRQEAPGVPLLVDGQPQFVSQPRVDLVRITDVRTGDTHPAGAGPITTEVDGLIVLPDLRDCHTPFADFDGDHDVDQDDFGTFQACRGVPSALTCRCLDRDGDGGIGWSDFEAFRRCAETSGPAIPADADCEGEPW